MFWEFLLRQHKTETKDKMTVAASVFTIAMLSSSSELWNSTAVIVFQPFLNNHM